jgi:hypothetical protein
MDQKQKLENPSEQSRLLGEIPKVIPEMVDTNLSPEKSSRKDKVEQIDLPELVIGETCNSGADFLGLSGFPIHTPFSFIYRRSLYYIF